MAQTETDHLPAASRLPHILGVLGGIGLLVGVILLWTGQFASRPTSTRVAFGSVENRDEPSKRAAKPQPTLLSTGQTSGSATSLTVPLQPTNESPASTASHGEKRRVATGTGDSTGSADNTDPPSTQQILTAKFKQAILGKWKQYSSGHRVLTVKEDGTAIIDVKLDGFAAFAFGEKLQFKIAWTIEGEELVFKTTGGTPKSGVNSVTSIYGDRRVYRIREINSEQMLLNEKDEEKTPWDRVKDGDAPDVGLPDNDIPAE